MSTPPFPPPQDPQREARALAVLALRPRVVRYLVRRFGSWHLAEDVFADVLVEALDEPLDEPPADRPDGEWLRRWVFDRAVALAHSRSRTERRRARRAGLSLDRPRAGGETTVDAVPSPEPAPGAVAAGRELWARVASQLAVLPGAEAELLRAFAQGVPAAVLAQQQGVSRHVISRRLREARTMLLAALPGDVAAEVRLLLRRRGVPRAEPESARAEPPRTSSPPECEDEPG